MMATMPGDGQGFVESGAADQNVSERRTDPEFNAMRRNALLKIPAPERKTAVVLPPGEYLAAPHTGAKNQCPVTVKALPPQALVRLQADQLDLSVCSSYCAGPSCQARYCVCVCKLQNSKTV